MAKKNYKTNIRTVSWISSNTLRATSDSIVSPFIPLYGANLNASSTQIGLIVSITSLLSIAQLFWAKLAEKLKQSRNIAISSYYLTSMFNFFYTIIQNIAGFISLRGIQSLFSSGSIPTSSTLLAERTREKDWGVWNGILQASLVLGTLIGVIGGGFLLSRFTDNFGFILIFVLAGVISLVSAILFHFAVPSEKKLKAHERWVDIEEVPVTLGTALTIMKTDRNFVLLVFANFIFVLGVNISAPFYIIFNTQTFELSIFSSAILTAVGLVLQLIFSLLTARFIEKIRTKEVLIIGGVLTSLFPIMYMLPGITNFASNKFVFFCILWSLNGIAWGVINTSLATLNLDIFHPRRRTIQIAINNSISAIALFIAPIVGGAIIQYANFTYLIFIISAIIRFVGALLFILITEPVIGGTILNPLRKIISVPVRSNIERIVIQFTTSIKNIPRNKTNTD